MKPSRLYYPLLLLPGLILRLALAPYTSGSDIPQFAGFADSLLRHGLAFFEYSDGSRWAGEGWPYPWPYVYGPLFILILGVLRVIAPGRVETYTDPLGVYYVKAPMDWITANKLLYIGFDTLAALLIYRLALRLTSSNWKAVSSMLLYYYNPMVAYISCIYGMFDQIPLALTLAGLALYLEKGSLGKLSILWGLAVSVKPNILIAMIPFYIHLLTAKGWRPALYSAAITGLVVAALFAPFLAWSPGSLLTYIQAVKSVSTPNYYSPPIYSFNGFSSIAFYAWIHGGVNATPYLSAWIFLFAPLYAGTLYYAWRTRDPVMGMALAQLVFTASYWRVNHQYLVATIGFTALALPLIGNAAARTVGAASIVLAGVWPLLYPTSFWATVHVEEISMRVYALLSMLSLNIADDLFYVYYSLALTISELTLIVLVFSSLGERGRGLSPISDD